MFATRTDLNQLRRLHAEINREQNYLFDVKLIACSPTTTEFRTLIEAVETRHARLQGELDILTATFTKTIDETFSAQPVMKQVMKLRELEGMTFDSIARRLQCSLRWVLELHKRGLELLTVTNSTPLATGYTR